MKKIDEDQWVKKVRDGRVFYDRKSLDRPLQTTEEYNLDCFAEKYRFKQAPKFKQAEKDFLSTLSPQQKEQYFMIFEMLEAYRSEREKRLVSFVRDWGRVTFD